MELDRLTQREAEVAAADAELPARLADVNARLAEVRAETAAIPAAVATLDAAGPYVMPPTGPRRWPPSWSPPPPTTNRLWTEHRACASTGWTYGRHASTAWPPNWHATCPTAARAPCAAPPTTPSPASPAPSAPSADDELAAEQAHEAALSEREAAERTLASLESRHTDAVSAAGGLDTGTAETTALQAQEELVRLEAIAEREPALAAELERIETERDRVRDQARELGELFTAHRTHRTHYQAERARLVTRLLQSGLLDSDPLVRGGAEVDTPSRRPPCWPWPRRK